MHTYFYFLSGILQGGRFKLYRLILEHIKNSKSITLTYYLFVMHWEKLPCPAVQTTLTTNHWIWFGLLIFTVYIAGCFLRVLIFYVVSILIIKCQCQMETPKLYSTCLENCFIYLDIQNNFLKHNMAQACNFLFFFLYGTIFILFYY